MAQTIAEAAQSVPQGRDVEVHDQGGRSYREPEIGQRLCLVQLNYCAPADRGRRARCVLVRTRFTRAADLW
jgi:hypothetical protein